MNIKEFLIENKINYLLYDLKVIKINDILLLDKTITQKVTQKFEQLHENQTEWLNQNKKFLSSTHKFTKNDLPIGHHIIKGIEPDTIEFTDCVTCDGHGHIPCPTCQGKGEIVCIKCQGTKKIKSEIIKSDFESVTCTSCGGHGTKKYKCTNCGGHGKIEKKQICGKCQGKGKIFNQTKNMWEPCTTCQGRGGTIQIESCNKCSGLGYQDSKCLSCNGSGSVKKEVKKKEIQETDCQFCSLTGRTRCPTCNGLQELVCTTCKGTRKTNQFYMNYFEVDVKDNISILSGLYSQDIVSTIFLSKNLKKVTSITEEEKQKIILYGQNNNLKITPETTKKVNGVLYKLVNKKHPDLIYYIWEDNNIFYYQTLPDKDNLNSSISYIFKKIFNFISPLYKKIISLVKYLTNKKDY